MSRCLTLISSHPARSPMSHNITLSQERQQPSQEATVTPVLIINPHIAKMQNAACLFCIPV